MFLPADEAVNLVEEVGATLKSNSAIPESVIKKYENVFTKNSGYVILREYFKEGILLLCITYRVLPFFFSNSKVKNSTANTYVPSVHYLNALSYLYQIHLSTKNVFYAMNS